MRMTVEHITTVIIDKRRHQHNYKDSCQHHARNIQGRLNRETTRTNKNIQQPKHIQLNKSSKLCSSSQKDKENHHTNNSMQDIPCRTTIGDILPEAETSVHDSHNRTCHKNNLVNRLPPAMHPRIGHREDITIKKQTEKKRKHNRKNQSSPLRHAESGRQ